jgi:hypothetical protein
VELVVVREEVEVADIAMTSKVKGDSSMMMHTILKSSQILMLTTQMGNKVNRQEVEVSADEEAVEMVEVAAMVEVVVKVEVAATREEVIITRKIKLIKSTGFE